MKISSTDILFILIIFQLLFLSLFLLTRKNGKQVSNILLGSFFLAICINLLDIFLSQEGFYFSNLQFAGLGKYGPVPAIIISSIIFTLIHLSKNWAHTIIPHIFFASVLLGILAYKSGSLIPGIIGHSILDIFDYSFWWTDIAGGFKKQTIFITGVDIHFIIWILIFSLALFIFYKSIAKLKPEV